MRMHDWRVQADSKFMMVVPYVLIITGACSEPLMHFNYAREPDPRRGQFVLGPSDELHITVWHNPGLTTEAVVRPDGTVTIPLIGDLRAAGRTPRMLRDDIRTRLKAYVKEGAVVTVAVTRVNSYRFTVAGRVNRVGTYSAQHYVTVAEAIAMAGGPTRFADAGQTRVVRRDARGAVHHIPVDYPAIAAGKLQQQNIVLLPGDAVYVP